MAVGLIWKEAENDDRTVFRCSLSVRSEDLETEQVSGPKFFPTEAQGRKWIVREASYHGFAEGEFDIKLEE